MNRCNKIQANFLGLILELTFSCSFKQMFWYLESIPPLAVSQDQITQKHTCKLESNRNYEISSFMNIYPFLIILYQIFSFYNLLMLHQSEFPTYIFHLYLIIIIFPNIVCLRLLCLQLSFLQTHWILLVLLPLRASYFSWTANMS